MAKNVDTIAKPKKASGKASLAMGKIDTKKSKSKIANNSEARHHPIRQIFKIVSIFALAVLLVVISFAGAAYAYQDKYQEKALYGTRILGQEMGGLTKKEVEKIISDVLDDTSYGFSVDGKDFTVTSEEMGIAYNTEETVENAWEMGRHGDWLHNALYGSISLAYKVNNGFGGWLSQGTTYHIDRNVSVVYKIDEKKLEAFTKKISNKFNSKSQDAGLVIKGDEVKVVPAVYGRAVASESIKAQVRTALDNGNSATIEIAVAEVEPEIIETEAAESIAAAEKILENKATYIYDGKKYTPSKEVMGSWIVFKKQKNKLVPLVESSKVKSYLDGIAKKINISAINQKVRVVNSNDREITQKGKNGLAVDTTTPAAKTATSLNTGSSISLTLTTYTVKYKTEFNNVLVANWDKYIEVNLSTQRMCAYLAGGEKVNCWAITTGQYNVINGVSTRTPTGTFLIRRKSGAGGVAGGPGGGGVCMPNPPDTKPLCGINYVSTFTPQGHAIHEAWWRTSFGTQAFKWNGSHGCINSPYEVAKFIYNWAPVGTPVVIHY